MKNFITYVWENYDFFTVQFLQKFIKIFYKNSKDEKRSKIVAFWDKTGYEIKFFVLCIIHVRTDLLQNIFLKKPSKVYCLKKSKVVLTGKLIFRVEALCICITDD